MNISFQLTAVAALLAVSGVSQALTTTSGIANFSGSAAVTASQSYPNTPSGTTNISVSNSNNGAAVSTVGLSQFSAATGVLTGVDLQATSSRTQTMSGSGYKGNGAGKTYSGSGSSTAALTASGASLNFSTPISQIGGSCSLASGMTGSVNCSWGPTSSSATATNGSTSVANGNLNDYVGSGSTNATLSLPTLSATDTQSTNAGQASGSSATYSVAWSGSLQASYSYLLHALASFNGSSSSNVLTLDFGSVQQYSAASLGFAIYNMANADRTGLDLDGFSGSGDTSRFASGLGGFSSLTQGSNNSFLASMLTDTLGVFSASYLLNLSDANVGASSTWQNQTLTLNLIGEVTAAPVPVPAAAWLFGGALLSLTRFRRFNSFV